MLALILNGGPNNGFWAEFAYAYSCGAETVGLEEGTRKIRNVDEHTY